MRITEMNTQRGLSPSGLNMSDFVVNPYRGCAFGCLYCYVRKNKIAQRTPEPWGEFVDVKINIADLIQKELCTTPAGHILIGSVTDPYQPVELRYGLTRKILKICQKNSIQVTILTRSNHILRDIDLLKALPNTRVHFTINWPYKKTLKIFEKRSPLFNQRLKTIATLREHDIRVIPNISPLFPGLFDPVFFLQRLAPLVREISFESFNLKVIPQQDIDRIFDNHFKDTLALFKKVYTDEQDFYAYWDQVKNNIERLNAPYGLDIEYLFHSYDSYFGRD